MKTLKEITQSSFEVKGSKFLVFLLPAEAFENILIELKIEHSKARHFVYAYRVFGMLTTQKNQSFKELDSKEVNQNSNQIIERFSDDGEPKGSSGIPVLNVLRGEDLVNVAAIIVRYFGGVLLGTGGLARAYTQSVLASLKIAKDSKVIIPFEFRKSIDLKCPYPLLNRIEYLAKTLDVVLSKDIFEQDYIKLSLSGSIQGIEKFLTHYEQDLKFRV